MRTLIQQSSYNSPMWINISGKCKMAANNRRYHGRDKKGTDYQC